MELAAEGVVRRRAGVLLHPTSLPGALGQGDLGPQAYHFVDWLAASGFAVWQMLPLGPVHSDGSPYQCLSAFAGNPQLISPHLLLERGWLPANAALDSQPTAVRQAFDRWYTAGSPQHDQSYRHFIQQHQSWLEDFALFVALRELHEGESWSSWPSALRDREPAALAHVREQQAELLAWISFQQYLFFEQWGSLKRYANQRGVELLGDMPIFVAYDSADVWSQRQLFLLDDKGMPTVVAGVPPDYFSTTGQRWGNPLYHWENLQKSEFAWWTKRFEHQLALFDQIRIDHFRGFEAYWEIEAHCDTAINGRWVPAPGAALFDSVLSRLGHLPVVAEDLGVITPAVEALRDRYHFPGMKILQFAFGGDASNPYLPHNHVINSVVYTGTHDNDTTLGWYRTADDKVRHHLLSYLGEPAEEMPWPLVRAAFRSVARLAVVPMQDLLALDGTHRMNTPGTTEGNWGWRFSWDQVDPNLAARLREMVRLYGR